MEQGLGLPFGLAQRKAVDRIGFVWSALFQRGLFQRGLLPPEPFSVVA